MILNLSISGTGEVVTLAEAKAHCNCDVSTWDTLFPIWIDTAVSALQNFTNVAFLPSDVECTVIQDSHDYVGCYVKIPFGNNAVLTGDSAVNYTLVGDRIKTSDREFDLTYTAGGPPEAWMKQSVLMYVSDLFENRGEAQQHNVGEAAKQNCKSFVTHGAFF